MNKAERKVLKRIKDKDEDNYLPGHDILFKVKLVIYFYSLKEPTATCYFNFLYIVLH